MIRIESPLPLPSLIKKNGPTVYGLLTIVTVTFSSFNQCGCGGDYMEISINLSRMLDVSLTLLMTLLVMIFIREFILRVVDCKMNV